MKRIIKVLVSIISLVVLGIFSTGCGSNNVKITKEQQDNVVKILSKNYDIKSIEFKKVQLSCTLFMRDLPHHKRMGNNAIKNPRVMRGFLGEVIAYSPLQLA